MDGLIAVEEAVITILDKQSNQPLAFLRRNGEIVWYAVKGKPSWTDYQRILNVQTTLR